MLLARCAGEDGDWPDASAPVACESEEAPAEQRGGEVLLRDRGFAAFPALAELMQVGNDDIAQERVDREPR